MKMVSFANNNHLSLGPSGSRKPDKYEDSLADKHMPHSTCLKRVEGASCAPQAGPQ